MNKKQSYFNLSLWAFLAVICLAAIMVPVNAQENETVPPLKIAIKDITPFIFEENGRKVGFSIDLWQAVAAEANLPYEFVEVESVTEQIDAVAQGEVDAAIAAISMTSEREEQIDFSFSYFDAGLQIMTRQVSFLPLRSLFEILFSPEVFAALLGLVVIVILFGHLVWLFERRHNPDFQHGYLRGVWEGIWWSAVTVTTVGYGDRTPTAVLGRLLALIWMLVGLIILANFTATITTQLTLKEMRARIQGVEDLRGKTIATVSGSTAADYLRRNQLAYVGTETIDEAYAMLSAESVDAVIYDAPVLLYHIHHEDKSENFAIVGDLLERERYGIALPPDSPYKDDINIALLTILENGLYDEMVDKWFSSLQ